MTNLERDLDRFLRTDGLQILIDSGIAVKNPDNSLTVKGLEADQESKPPAKPVVCTTPSRR